MYHPPRGGVRGGRDQFNWEDVKTDKHRENYLGHSLFAPVGRWQQGKDLTWYSKEGKQNQARLDEIKAVKETEADVMAEFLGAGKKKVVTGNVSQQELSNVLKREQDYDEEDNEVFKEATQDATKGLGYKSSGRVSVGEIMLAGVEATNEEFITKSDGSPPTSLHEIEHSKTIPAIASIDQSEDRLRSKKQKKEKKKKHKKDKHRSNKDRHSKRIGTQDDDELSGLSDRSRKRYRDGRHDRTSKKAKYDPTTRSRSRSRSPHRRDHHSSRRHDARHEYDHEHFRHRAADPARDEGKERDRGRNR